MGINLEGISFSIETRLIDHIGLAMYSGVAKAICELVANGYDADATVVKISLPEPILETSVITIEDNGTGMDRTEIVSSYMHLGGAGRRSKSERTEVFKRPLLGSKGIGKLAGLGVANRMTIITRKAGKKCTFEINRHLLDQPGATLERISFPFKEENSIEASGTVVVLDDLLPHATRTSSAELKSTLIRQFGCPPNFEVYVNGERFGVEDIPGRQIIVKENIAGCGEVRGTITIAERERDVPTPGIVTRARGRAILGPTFFDINKPGVGGHQFRVVDRIYGEIEATFFDPEKPEHRIDEFAISTDRDGVNINHPKYLAYKQWVETRIRTIARDIERELAAKRREQIRERLKRFPPHVVKYARHVLQSIDFSQMSEREAVATIEAVARALESTAMREILEKLKDADPRDLQKLAVLLQDWGFYEIAMIAEMIRGRLEALEKFSLVVSDLASLEYRDVHSLLENNIWILGDSYKLFSSNKTLKTILDKELDAMYRGNEKKRPDIIVKTLQEQLILIELKRPNYIIGANDLPQLLKYLSLVKRHMPQVKVVDCFLIGGKYDESIQDMTTREGDRIFRTSYVEIITNAQFRYKEIIDVLTEEITSERSGGLEKSDG
jgi:hypothetical protein